MLINLFSLFRLNLGLFLCEDMLFLNECFLIKVNESEKYQEF